MKATDGEKQAVWAQHSEEWRDTAQVVSQWREASNTSPSLLQARANKGWWETLERLGATLFVTREYEHLAIAMSAAAGKPRTTFLPMPHPSGLTVDRKHKRVFIASTRNPNQVYTLKPIRGRPELPCAPVESTFYPGGLYIHDLALFGGVLHANAVGQNAVVRLDRESQYKRVWWPRCIEEGGEPVFSRNHIQLNSIAAGATLRDSFFSASSCRVGRLRPGHVNYPVDGRGVIFSGKTREPVCTGLTRPHSARLRGRDIWVDNSGYGQLGFVSDGKLEIVARLPGWTRGLCFIGDTAFVGTSRVIPRFSKYAPGLDFAASRCGVHAVSCKTGKVVGSIEWPHGNQIFAIDWLPSQDSQGFPFDARSRRHDDEIALFYSYATE